MQATVIGVVRSMEYFLELLELLFQPRCDKIDCGSYDLEDTGEIEVLPPQFGLLRFDSDLGGNMQSWPRIRRKYRCNKCQGTSWQ